MTEPSLRTLCFAALGRLVPAGEDHPELRQFQECAESIPHAELRAALHARLLAPEPRTGVSHIAVTLHLSAIEVFALVLLFAVESEPLVGRAFARLQAPLGGSRPTLGLLARVFDALDEPPQGTALLAALATGSAVHSGLFQLLHDDLPLAERALSLPLHVFLALCGRDAAYPTQSATAAVDPDLPLPDSAHDEARRLAAALRAEPRAHLTIRGNSPLERRAAARLLAAALGLRALFLEGEQTTALAPLLHLRGLLPVFCFDLGPGERKAVPTIPRYAGPVVALAGPDGILDTGARGALRWSFGVPDEDDRRALWTRALGPGAAALAHELAADHRHGAARIAELGRLARQSALLAGRHAPVREDVARVARDLDGSGLSGLAELLADDIPDAALILTAGGRRDLDALLARCRGRDRKVDGLGVSALARYRHGVRALFVGPSGTGKTLAAGWLATRLGLPLYRVDLAAVTSKYIGETEKNLAQLLAHAEHAEVLLLFDEADSLFARRTDVRDANDRFANAQTNYLLQRIESFDGITLLTSNSRARFDDAFSRRLDVVIEFPQPTPEERRRLWRAHIGDAVNDRTINHLAAALDLAGGHVRNIVLAAAAVARSAGRPLRPPDLLAGVEAEYRKLGRTVPAGVHGELQPKVEP